MYGTYWNLKKTLAILFALLFIGTILYYAYYQSRGIIAGPTIDLISPTQGEYAEAPLLDIRGRAERAKELTLDGRPIFVDLSGNFAEQLLLFPGYNIIELAAKDADGREMKKTVEVIWNGTTSPRLPLLSSSIPTVATSVQMITQ